MEQSFADLARVKKSGNYQYLQLVENRKEKGRVKQQFIATLGRIGERAPRGVCRR